MWLGGLSANPGVSNLPSAKAGERNPSGRCGKGLSSATKHSNIDTLKMIKVVVKDMLDWIKLAVLFFLFHLKDKSIAQVPAHLDDVFAFEFCWPNTFPSKISVEALEPCVFCAHMKQ